MWSLMKWCQEFGWVQNDRPPSFGVFDVAEQLLAGGLGVIVCESPSLSRGRRSAR